MLSLPVPLLSNSLPTGGEEPERGYAEGRSLVRGGKPALNPFIRVQRVYIFGRAHGLGDPTLNRPCAT